ncbi:MAG TPA: 2-amino-4-hydroxy-6-hydroxymethyldihydropteridine diphosphokinase [Prolixibacteraceae bacterium]|nr:2-amino-4-hydroxy-6-hydroxymethyldihydropteridine diphosphokinase [Prolixibacteraceae bacterium]
MEEHQLFLCLGGNLGPKAENFHRALMLIEERIGPLRKVSPVYASPPWGFRTRYPFWNQVAEVATRLSPEAVLREIGDIERLFGRKRGDGGYRSRKMDVDILFYDRLVMTTGALTLPHPRLAERRFVLVPLADIAPELIHPVTGMTVARMLATSSDPSAVTPVSPQKLHPR